ncbi:unnamed protein product [Echinostoma caproni]|uniref:Integrase catalytic domain-containing protein n=1 Tax=Echinostoma caproni TaxID=27848 RepID=A0A183BDD9_9TREM|nr:unnamed protein product [Echinostoma caproni]
MARSHPNPRLFPGNRSQRVPQAVASFGCPAIVTTDSGASFERASSKLLATPGTQQIKSTAYHPAANKMMERFHGLLKAALQVPENPRWSEVLSLSTLGIPDVIKSDFNASLTELVYGPSLRFLAN